MSYYPTKPLSILLTLKTADGRTGVQLLNEADDQAMAWTANGDGETVSASFKVIDEHGKCIAKAKINGDEWRQLEDSGELCYVWIWVRRGCSLEDAIYAATEQCDPDGMNNDYETALEEKDAEIARLIADSKSKDDQYQRLLSQLTRVREFARGVANEVGSAILKRAWEEVIELAQQEG